MLTSRARATRSFATRQILRSIMTSSKTETKPVWFGPFEVTNQVFLRTPYSFALVNLKPLIQGHILVCPLNPHRRLTDLSSAEVTDLFTTVQLTQRMLAQAYFPQGKPEDGSFSVAVQDGAQAGQTVPHVHVHVIPRQQGDLRSPDEIYVKMASEEGNIGGALWDVRERPSAGGSLPKIEDADRVARGEQEMVEEAEKYKSLLEKMGATQ